MISAYQNNRDIYATIASIAFDKPYEECLEFYPDGTTNDEGKERRGRAKVVVLALTYGMSDQGLADSMGMSLNDAKNLMNNFFEGFPKVKRAVDDNLSNAKQTGFVQTVWGRKRRLPDLLLEPYEITARDGEELNPSDRLLWLGKIQKAFGRSKQQVVMNAASAGVKIIDNTGKISTAERQSFNSKIQGTASDITKLAMLAVGMNEELKRLDYHMIMTVHDEIIGTAPRENAARCRDIVEQLMIAAPTELLTVPMKVDMSIHERWYGEALNL